MPRRSSQPSPEAEHLDHLLGGAIRRFRREKGLSQHALAARLSLSGQQLQKYESAANRVSASALYRIARELDQPVTAFFPPGPVHDAAHALNESREGRALAHGYLGIRNDAHRKALLVIVEGLASRASSL